MINKIIFFICSIFISLSVMFCVTITSSRIFLEPIREKEIYDRFKSGQLVINKSVEHQQITTDAVWTSSSIVFFIFFMSLYWFFYGRVSKIYFHSYPTIIILLLPVLCNIQQFNHIQIHVFYSLPLYVLVCFFGIKSANFKRDQTTTDLK